MALSDYKLALSPARCAGARPLLVLATLSLGTLSLSSCDEASDISRYQVAAGSQSGSGDKVAWLSPERLSQSSETSLALANGASQNQNTTEPQQRLPIMDLAAGQVCEGVPYRNKTGERATGTKTCKIPRCTDSVFVDCQTTKGYPSLDMANLRANRANMYASTVIAGVQGTHRSTDYTDCQRTGDTNCTSTQDLRAVAKSVVHEGVVKKGFTIDRQFKGKFPSAEYPATAIPNGSIPLTTSNFNEAIGSEKKYHFWNIRGQLQQITGDRRLVGNHIVRGHTVYGVGGQADNTQERYCDKSGDEACVIKRNGEWLAAKSADIVPAFIKKGVQIMGVTGSYPSASARLLGSDINKTDLNLDTNAQLKTNDTYEFFDRFGNRHIGWGDADLKPENLMKGLTILGVKGAVDGHDMGTISPDDVRNGIVIRAKHSSGRLFPAVICVNPQNCADFAWRKVKPDEKTEAVVCDKNAHKHCVLRNQPQQLDYLFSYRAPTVTWEQAASYCHKLGYMGKTDWRLPTQKELMQAASNHIHATGLLDQYDGNDEALRMWTSTFMTKESPRSAVVFGLKNLLFETVDIAPPGVSGGNPKHHAICVRKPGAPWHKD